MDRYQDYVIRDGRLIGRFEEMYQRFDDPWHQSTVGRTESFSRAATLITLRKFGIRSVLEVGCGLGHFTDLIAREAGVRPVGLDISETAISKARQQFPGLRFEVGHVLDIARFADLDAVLFAEVTWYILESLPEVIEILRRHWAGKYLFHNLVFYKGELQEYGREYFRSLDELIAYMPFPLVARAEATTERDDTIETSTIFRIPGPG